VSAPPADPRAGLEAAVREGDAGRARELLAAAPPGRASGAADGIPLVLLAVYHGHPDVAQVLLEHGAPLDAFAAAALGRADALAGALRDTGAGTLGSTSPDGWTPLHLAAFFGHLDAVEVLLEAGADVRARSANELANTPLHAAVAGGRRAVAERLVACGADVNAEAGGLTPLDLACAQRDDALAGFLVANGARKATRRLER